MSLYTLGPKGSFHHIAISHAFPKEREIFFEDGFEDILKKVVSKKDSLGIIAIENSSVGSLLENYDLMFEYEVSIVKELYLRISHNLIGIKGTSLDEIRKVISHPVAIKQCRKFFKKYSNIMLEESRSSAHATSIVKTSKDKSIASIGSKLASEIYELDVISTNIEMNHNNFTRFFVISGDRKYPVKANKTSIVFSVQDKPGALGNIFQIFAKHNINVSKIESRPIVGTQWEYYFYLDFELHVENELSKKVLNEIQEYINFLKILGTYESKKIVEEE